MISKIFYGLQRRVWFYLNKNRFGALGAKSYIFKPLLIQGRKNIYIDSHVYIGYKAYLGSSPYTGVKDCKLKIGKGSIIGNFNHFYATKSIIIGSEVLTADKVYISDNLHSYEDPEVSIIKQPIKQIGEVIIGDHSWIGENVCIMGVKIGKHCVIGANSVVVNDIPDYSIAVGNPAKVIKKYCFNEKKWLKISKNKNF